MSERPEPCRGLCSKQHCGFVRPDHCAEWTWIQCQRCKLETCESCNKWMFTLRMLELLASGSMKP